MRSVSDRLFGNRENGIATDLPNGRDIGQNRLSSLMDELSNHFSSGKYAKRYVLFSYFCCRF